MEDDNDQDILDQHVSRVCSYDFQKITFCCYFKISIIFQVWSDMTPNRSPGNLSPCNPLNRRKQHEMGVGTSKCCKIFNLKNIIIIDFFLGAQSSMRYSKSMPENANLRKLASSKWGSINTDSGISLFSSDTITKHSKDSSSISSSSSIGKQQRSLLPSDHMKIEEIRRKQEEEARR